MPPKYAKQQSERRTEEEMLEHLNSFELDLKFSAGVWFFWPGGGRFNEAYVDEPESEDEWFDQLFEKAAELKKYGLSGLEAHYPTEVDESNIDRYKEFEKQTGIGLVSIVPNLFYDRQWEWGSLSNPQDEIREKALERAKKTLELNKELDNDFAVMWPGNDGYELGFGIDFMNMRDRFCRGVAEAMDEVPGVGVALEPKPYEPRARILYGTTSEGILMAEKVESMLQNEENLEYLQNGHSMVGLNPEVGHILMGYENMPYAFSLVMEYGKLFHTHWNSQPLGNYDQDQNVWAMSPEQTEAALYALKMHGYEGHFGIDINPARMPVERALINCFDAMKAARERINRLDHEKVLAANYRPQDNRGLLEALLTRSRAPESADLSDMPDIE